MQYMYKPHAPPPPHSNALGVHKGSDEGKRAKACTPWFQEVETFSI